MPLSEEEQRILHEMEQKLYEHDPSFVDRVNVRRSHGSAARSCRWAVLVFVVAFASLIATFRASTLIGAISFLVMLFAAFYFEHGVRQLEGPLFGSVSRALRSRGIGDEFTELQRRVRDRFKRQH